jgi:hypothetical protein
MDEEMYLADACCVDSGMGDWVVGQGTSYVDTKIKLNERSSEAA